MLADARSRDLLPSITCSRVVGDLLQDAPFSVVNTLFLLRTAHDPKKAPCTEAYDPTTVTVLLLVLLTTVASFTYKIMKLRMFPEIWREHQRLLREKVELRERARRLSQEEVVPRSEGSESESGDSGSDTNCDPVVLAHSGPRSSVLLGSVATTVIALPASADEALHSSSALRIGHSQLRRVELTMFEICMLPQCGR
jgi:nucleotide-binding universal stress UspA family protein